MLSRKPRFLCICCGHWTFENSPGARPPDTHAWSPWWPLPKEGAHVAGDKEEKDEEGSIGVAQGGSGWCRYCERFSSTPFVQVCALAAWGLWKVGVGKVKYHKDHAPKAKHPNS